MELFRRESRKRSCDKVVGKEDQPFKHHVVSFRAGIKGEADVILSDVGCIGGV